MAMEKNLEKKFRKLFEAIRKKVKKPTTRQYRQWNAEEPPPHVEITGRVQKFIFTLMVVVGNAVLAVLLFHLSSAFFSWLFFSIILASLIPKLYGSFRYLNSENELEKRGIEN